MPGSKDLSISFASGTAVKYRHKSSFVGGPTMKRAAKKRSKSTPRKPVRTARKSAKTSNAAVIIRQMGHD
jgi:hypothetical protein